MRTRRGPTRRDATLGTLAALLGGAGSSGCGGRDASAAVRRISGGFVDEGVALGHALRDGALSGGGGSPRRERRTALIVGGGVAGLAAAWRLARAGVEGVTVLELARDLGGTVRSGDHVVPGHAPTPHPFGAHYLPLPRAEQRALSAFLLDAGILQPARADGVPTVRDDALVRDPEERVAALGGWFEEGLWPRAGARDADHAELERFEALVEAHIAVSARDGKRLFDFPLAHSSTEGRELDCIDAAEWFEAQGFRSERLRWYLEYAARDDFGARLEDTSAWALLHYFTARADLVSKESASYLTWPEGNARLVRALAELAGVEVVTGEVALDVESDGALARVRTVATGAQGRTTHWTADAAIVATPQFVTRRIVRGDRASGARAALRYGPWLVANLHLARRPENRGFPFAWDSVIHGSKSLGYVDAAHQLDRSERHSTVWTWYLPITDADERAAREELLQAPWEVWRNAILRDLQSAHADIDEVVEHIDVWRWGHGMVKPAPGALWHGERGAAAEPLGRVHFANTDLSCMALFEEAHWHGTRAAEEVLAALGIRTESLL